MSFFFPEDYIINKARASPDIRISCFLGSGIGQYLPVWCLNTGQLELIIQSCQLAWQLNQKIKDKILFKSFELDNNNPYRRMKVRFNGVTSERTVV